MASRLLTLTLWALVLACAAFWGLRVFAPRTAVPAEAQMPARAVALGGELRRLLGASVVDTDDEGEDLDEGSGRFHLLGVVSPRGASHSTQGVALIAVDGQPPKAWRTGSTLEGDAVLLAVGPRSVQIGPRGGPATTELTLPDPSAATTAGAAPRPMSMPPNRVAPMTAPGVSQPPPGVQPHAPAAQPVQRNGRAEQEDEEEDE